MQMKRIGLLDDLRGITLISMILYHGAWDLVHIYDVKWDWYLGTGAYIWQQSICWVFILLSGFCWSMGKRPVKRGLMVLCGGFLVSLVTEFVITDARIQFGVLTFLGSAILLTIPLRQWLERIPVSVGAVISFVLFFMVREINVGYLGFEKLRLLPLPRFLYQLGPAGNFLGFTTADFYSSDYFSLFPWYFLFLTGLFLYRIAEKKGLLQRLPEKHFFPPFLGKNSLLVYLLHQPLVYGILYLIMPLFA